MKVLKEKKARLNLILYKITNIEINNLNVFNHLKFLKHVLGEHIYNQFKF